MTYNAIEIKNLTKIFAPNNKAIDDLSLTVKSGEILALLGPNGAGKSTTIRVLSTLCGFDSGNTLVAGLDVDKEPDKVRQSIGVVAQKTGVDYFLTGRENMLTQGQMYHMKRADIDLRIDELAKHFDLSKCIDNLVSSYSGGMTRKLDIAMALIHHPKILYLDEPTLGLDTRSRKMLWKLIQNLNEHFGLTILLTTHYLDEADDLAHRVAIINTGKIQIIGTSDELKNSIHGDSISITFNQVGTAEQGLAHSLKENGLAKDTVWEGNNLHLYVDNGADSVPKIMAAAAEQNVDIKSLALARPTLDDVFLKYTGSSIEGDGEEEGDEWWKQWAGKGGGGKWAKQWEDAEGEEGEGDGSDVDPDWEGNEWTKAGADTNDWQNNEWNEGLYDKDGKAIDEAAAAAVASSKPEPEPEPEPEKPAEPEWEGNEWTKDGADTTDWQNNEWNKDKDKK